MGLALRSQPRAVARSIHGHNRSAVGSGPERDAAHTHATWENRNQKSVKCRMRPQRVAQAPGNSAEVMRGVGIRLIRCRLKAGLQTSNGALRSLSAEVEN